MRRGGSGLVLLAAAFVLGPPPAGAQQPDTLVLTLGRAQEIALRSNPAYRSVAGRLELNGPETRAAWASDILPRLSVNLLNTRYLGNLVRRGVDDFGNPVANPDAEFVYFSSTGQAIGLSWQLSGPSLWNRVRRIGVENRGRELGEEIAREELRLEVAGRFFETLEQDELLALEEELVDASQADLESAERLFELVLRSRVDVLEAELAVEQRRLAVRRQRGARDRARLALRASLGQADLPPFRPASTGAPLFDPAGLDQAELLQRAGAGSPAVRRARDALRTAELGVSESRGSYWPSLTAGLSVGRLTQAPGTESLLRFGGLDDDLTSRFFLNLSVPFFDDFFGNRRDVARARVERRVRESELVDASLEAERATRSALLTLRDRWDEVGIAERSLAIATEALELAREEYRLGGRTFRELQQSVRDEADVRRQLIQARYGFVDALVELETAVGGPVR